MPTSKVYFTDLRTQIGVSQLDKLEKLIRAAGIGDIDFDHKMTAIKIPFRGAGQPDLPAAQLRQAGGRRDQVPGRSALPDRLQHPVPRAAEERPGAHRERL